MSREIRIRMLENDRTAKSIYEAVGMSEATWYQRMRDSATWRLGELRSVAEELGSSVADLVA